MNRFNLYLVIVGWTKRMSPVLGRSERLALTFIIASPDSEKACRLGMDHVKENVQKAQNIVTAFHVQLPDCFYDGPRDPHIVKGVEL